MLRQKILDLIAQYEEESDAPSYREMTNAFLLKTVAHELKAALDFKQEAPERWLFTTEERELDDKLERVAYYRGHVGQHILKVTLINNSIHVQNFSDVNNVMISLEVIKYLAG